MVKCGPGQDKVRAYTKADGTRVKAYCRDLPHDSAADIAAFKRNLVKARAKWESMSHAERVRSRASMPIGSRCPPGKEAVDVPAYYKPSIGHKVRGYTKCMPHHYQ